MSNLQDLVYSLEVGDLRKWMLRAAVLFIVLLLGGYYLGTQFNGLKQPEAMDQAQIARQISQGEGFTTKFIRPIILKYSTEGKAKEEVDFQAMPDLVNPPVYPYLLAAAFKVTGVSFEVDKTKLKDFTTFRPEMVMGGFNLVCLVLAIAVFYTWMIRAFDDRVAIVASLLFIFTNSIWEFVISGLNVPLLLLLICCLGAALNEAFSADEDEEGSTLTPLLWLGLAAIVAGLAFMTRYSMVALPLTLILVAGFLFRNRVAALVITIGVPLLISMPWLIRNINLSGNPFGYAWVQVYSYDSSLWRTFSDSLGGSIGLKQLITAMALGLGNQVENLGFYLGGFLLPGLFFVALFHTYKKTNVQNSLYFWLAASSVLFVLNAVIVKQSDPQEKLELNGLIVLVPVLAAFGTAFLALLLDRLKLPSRILQLPIIAVVLFIQLIPLGINILQRNPPRFAYPPYFPPVLFFIKDWVEPNEIFSSDIPWASAWYSDRVSVWIPLKKKDFYEMNDFKFRIAAMLFTPETSNRKMLSQIQTGEYSEWAALIKRTDLKDLPLPFFTALPPNIEQDYLLFADRPRWR